MKRLANLKKRSGFTLVELLIVIIIIGILAGGMLLVMGSSTDKAEATRIVSDLRTLKAAALLYYADTMKVDAPTLQDLAKYMDRTKETIASADYEVGKFSEASPDYWYVAKKNINSSGVRGKLGAMAEDSGLYSNKTCTAVYTGAGTETDAYMRAR